VWENFYFKVQKTPAECEKWLKQKAKVAGGGYAIMVAIPTDFDRPTDRLTTAPTAYAQCHKSNVTRRWPKTYRSQSWSTDVAVAQKANGSCVKIADCKRCRHGHGYAAMLFHNYNLNTTVSYKNQLVNQRKLAWQLTG